MRCTTVILFASLFCAACTPARTIPVEGQFILVDQSKYRDDQAKALAFQRATNDCRAKALAASAGVEKTIAGEKGGMENRLRARDQGVSMYTATYAACMNGLGYIQVQGAS
jgi:hypothetical protein